MNERQPYKERAKRLTYNDKVKAACDRILEHKRAFQGDINFVSGVKLFGHKAGFLTDTQAEQLGKTYKRVVNEGQFVKHDWWD